MRASYRDMIEYIPLNTAVEKDYVEIPVEGSTCGFGIQAMLSLRRRGDMAPQSHARHSFLSKVRIDQDRVVHIRQIHSKRVFVVTQLQGTDLKDKQGDGLITQLRDAILSVTVADCLPIFLLDKKNGCFGILHSGWKGTGIVAQAIHFMQKEFGTTESALRVILGPGIGACCYRVDKERYRLFLERYGCSSVKEKSGEYYLDLRGANIAILSHSCVEDIAVIEDCTSCNSLLGSFRREGQSSFTKMLALVGRLF